MFKKIMSVSLLTIMLVSMSITVFANWENSVDAGKYGKLTGMIRNMVETTEFTHVSLHTECTNTAPWLVTSCQALKYSTGECVYEKKSYSAYNTDEMDQSFYIDYVASKIKIYGTHEIRADRSYVVYTYTCTDAP